MSKPNTTASQQGAVLILVLWFIMLASLLIITMAGEVKLAAKAVYYQQQQIKQQADIWRALRLAEMEIMLEMLPPEAKSKDKKKLVSDEGKAIRQRFARFNGQPLTLYYPAPDNIEVRIYDHRGKINLVSFLNNAARFNAFVKQQLGDIKPAEKQALKDAWADWKDADDLKRFSGAEKKYYQKQDPPYLPRNNPQTPLESTAEILLVKGFDKLFKNINLNAQFTVYANHNKINVNLASPRILRTIPGLNDQNIAKIMALRNKKLIKSNCRSALKEILSANEINKADAWLDCQTDVTKQKGSIYTIAIRAKATIPKANKGGKTNSDSPLAAAPSVNTPQNKRAFLATIQVLNYTQAPIVLRIDPFGVLPE